MVRSAGHLYAVPISSIERTVHVGDEIALRTDEGAIELFSLDERLGIPQKARSRSATRSALLYPAGGRTVGLVVDEVLGKREIMVKPLLSPLDAMREYEGAALLQDGSLALVLDPVSLVSF
jgi:two-component system chemotaxis sensor kinase CheA